MIKKLRIRDSGRVRLLLRLPGSELASLGCFAADAVFITGGLIANLARAVARTKARELMANGQEAEDLEKTNPNMTWDQALEKYKGDYKAITRKSLESDEKTNKMIEQKRAAGGNS